jgi:hypothetical protein
MKISEDRKLALQATIMAGGSGAAAVAAVTRTVIRAATEPSFHLFQLIVGLPLLAVQATHRAYQLWFNDNIFIARYSYTKTSQRLFLKINQY